ncbi:MAG: polysaccharide deacetylase family protein [Nannocystaceae bacterium]|nr:polysaccharide deacetylase family protein [bacterium]
MDARTTAVSVDLDDLGCYFAVHGLEGAPASLALTRWLPRFLELFESLRIRATFFVIGRDVERDLAGSGEGAAVLRAALAAGHELASHSYAHAYDMSTWPQARVTADLQRCDALLRTLGGAPRGFRAPGYTHSAAMLRAVAQVGYAYDSSALPSPPYYLGKVAVMAAMAARGRRSASVASGAASFLGPRLPHRRRDVDLVELPMSVTPVARLPLIGTTLLSGPDLLRRRLVRRARTLPHLHLELHAIDLADARSEAIDADLPELRVPLASRRARLEALLRERGPCMRLDALAETI